MREDSGPGQRAGSRTMGTNGIPSARRLRQSARPVRPDAPMTQIMGRVACTAGIDILSINRRCEFRIIGNRAPYSPLPWGEVAARQRGGWGPAFPASLNLF
jgi:hypothetical protein